MSEKPFLKTALSLCSAAGLAMTLVGCANNKVTNDAQTDAQVCDALKNVIAHAGSNFDSLKSGNGVADYDHTRWDTKPIFKGADCDVIGWGAGKTNYACTWTKTESKDARSDFAYGLGVAKTCLGPEWLSTSIPGVTGEGARFSKAGSSVVIDVRLAQELPPSKNWLTSLTIGAPINRNAK